MKKFLIVVPIGDDDEEFLYTEADILKEYWNVWKGRMVKKYGINSDLITESNCIEDWITVNWAWEVTDGSVHSHTCAPYLLKLIKELQAEVIQLHDDISSLERELVYLRSDLI